MRLKDGRLAWAEAKLIEAQRIALRYFRKRLSVERKPDRSPVTIADRAIEDYLRRELQRAFPGEPIVGEEFGGSPSAGASATKRGGSASLVGGSYWTIDPIDGTRAFLKGLPSWGMLIGWVERGTPALGACLYPALGVFLGVGPGTPAHERSQGGRRIALRRAPTPPALRDAAIFHGGVKWWLPTRYRGGFHRLVSRCFLERAYGDCYGYLWLLRGGADAVIEYGVKVWDMAPLFALAHATGRVMCDFSGRSCFTGPETVMAHPKLARTIVKTLRARWMMDDR